MGDQSSEPFWDWAHQAYSQPGVETALLKLQDDFDLNVNIILWCCWAGAHGRTLPELAIRKAEDITRNWSANITGALRTARRALKLPPQQADPEQTERLRLAIKASELDAEKIEIEMLDALTGAFFADQVASMEEDTATQQDPARRSLATYVGLARTTQKPGFTMTLLEDVIDHIFNADSEGGGAGAVALGHGSKIT